MLHVALQQLMFLAMDFETQLFSLPPGFPCTKITGQEIILAGIADY
jgi:hypothetical protein